MDAATRLQLPASHADWLKAILATSMDGVTGPIRFDADKSLVTRLEKAVYRNGELKPFQ